VAYRRKHTAVTRPPAGIRTGWAARIIAALTTDPRTDSDTDASTHPPCLQTCKLPLSRVQRSTTMMNWARVRHLGDG